MDLQVLWSPEFENHIFSDILYACWQNMEVKLENYCHEL